MRKAFATNVYLWKGLFWEAWEPLPLDQKLAWIAFVGQTIAVLTLLEFLLLH